MVLCRLNLSKEASGFVLSNHFDGASFKSLMIVENESQEAATEKKKRLEFIYIFNSIETPERTIQIIIAVDIL